MLVKRCLDFEFVKEQKFYFISKAFQSIFYKTIVRAASFHLKDVKKNLTPYYDTFIFKSPFKHPIM